MIIITVLCIETVNMATANVYGHTMLKAPVLVRSLKLSNIGLRIPRRSPIQVLTQPNVA